ncbi:MAG: tRNA lysidine(34) synthetase TilS [Anaerolineales bacterium]|jgi:tRNA(Ile)-lysidine synthase|nr:tRNA lysidine(34) synthetase TilS [Anaerolineales bacterium]
MRVKKKAVDFISDQMVERVQATLRVEGQVRPGQRLLAAVSGGPDSLCLLDILSQLDYSLVVAHLDHQMRPESSDEASGVAARAASHGLACCLGQVDVRAMARERSLSLEEAARQARYEFLFQQAQTQNAQAVVTGHTADDQVETVLMHILRGSGLDGLSGMTVHSLPNTWSVEIPLIRPLLGVWREEVIAYLEARRLQAFEDSTNQDRRFYRNRIRQELLPILEDFTPGIRKRVWQMARLVSEERQLLEPLLEASWQGCLACSGKGWLAFHLPALQAQPPSIQRRLFRRAAYQLSPSRRDVDFHELARASHFLAQPPHSAQADWTGNLRLKIDHELLYVAWWTAELPGEQAMVLPQVASTGALELSIPGCIQLAYGWQISAEISADILEAKDRALNNRDPGQAWIDPKMITQPLQVRVRRPGDQIQPLGMAGKSTKLSDLMINRKLPRQARAGWPLVTCGEQIVWAPGLQLGESFCLSSKSQGAVRLMIYHPDRILELDLK